MKYTCENCGKEHEDWPALTYKAPDIYFELNERDRDYIAEIGSDHCIINRPDQVNRFIRVTLNQKVNNHCSDLQYGVWVSLSEKSFNDYADNFNNENHQTGYFGHLANAIPDYIDTRNIYTDVYTQLGNDRPIIVPHENFDHPFVIDYYAGITKEEAERRIRAMMGISAD